MAKQKFELTSELVRVEPEPEVLSSSARKVPLDKKIKKLDVAERLTINLDSGLKYQLQIYALNNKKNMTDVIHEALRMKLGLID